MHFEKTILILILPLLLIIHSGCPKGVTGEEALCIVNRSGNEMSFWHSENYPTSHFPDTVLPVVVPIRDGYASPIRGAGKGGCVGSNVGQRPLWDEVFSDLPAGLFTVYFFDTRPTTQAEWDVLRNDTSKVHRKDVTYEFLKNNSFTITYP